MKHATRAEASAARLAALKASREKRTYAKHERWAQEMRATGRWVVIEKREAQIVDSEGDAWNLAQDGLYRLTGDETCVGWTYEEIRRTYGIKEA